MHRILRDKEDVADVEWVVHGVVFADEGYSVKGKRNDE